VNADWLDAPRLCTLHTRPIGARSIKTWRAFGAPSHFLKIIAATITRSLIINFVKTKTELFVGLS